MYAQYQYLNGATQANVLADIVAILTGTTDVQTLSSSCNKPASAITASVRTAGWVVHDNAPGTANTVVLKAPVVDDPTKFKYFSVSTNTAGALVTVTYEGWNETTNTATNAAAWDSTNYQRVNFAFASGGTIYISASERYVVFSSISSGSTVGSNNQSGVTGVIEWTRWDPWNTVGNGYPSFGSLNGAGWSSAANQALRYRFPNGSDATGNSSSMAINSIGYTSFTNGKTTNAAGQFIVPLIPAYTSYSGGFMGGNISEITDLWFAPSGLGTNGDEIQLANGDTYVLLVGYSSNRIAVRKG